MELMEIIKSSLSIFSAVSFVFIITSYTVYKIKDRSRIKPYLRVNMQSAYNDFILEEIVEEKITPVEKIVENKKAVEEESIKLKQDTDVKVHERFKIVNSIKPVDPKFIPVSASELEKPAKRIKLNSAKLNIYELYSDTNEQMHKLKLALN
jgi:hypothetical protein